MATSGRSGHNELSLTSYLARIVKFRKDVEQSTDHIRWSRYRDMQAASLIWLTEGLKPQIFLPEA